MARVSSNDLRCILDAVHVLHHCEDPADLPSVMRNAVESLVKGDIVAYSEFDLTSLSPDQTGEQDLDELARLLDVSPLVTTDDARVEKEINNVVPWMVRFAEEHPLFRIALMEPDPPVAMISDFLSLPSFRDLGLYRQFFDALEVTRQIAVCPTRCQGLVTGLTVNRSGRDFSERDRSCLTLLTPHLRNAYQRTTQWAQLQEQISRHMQRLENLPTALVGLTDDARQIRFATRLGEKILLQCFPRFNGRHLPEPLKAWVTEILKCRGSVDGPRVVDTSKKLPTQHGILWIKLLPSSGRLHLILKLEDRETMARKLTQLGLTQREAEVLACLRDGGTNRQIARRLFVSPGTIRTHVERILSKLGVPTRTAAVRSAEEFLRHIDWN